jgi:hypothetical protein
MTMATTSNYCCFARLGHPSISISVNKNNNKPIAFKENGKGLASKRHSIKKRKRNKKEEKKLCSV